MRTQESSDNNNDSTTIDYHYQLAARGCYAALGAAFSLFFGAIGACLLVFCWVEDDSGALFFGILFSGVGCFGIVNYVYGVLSGEVWETGISNGTLWWVSPRFPKSSEVIRLDEISEVQAVCDDSCAINVRLNDGRRFKIPYFGDVVSFLKAAKSQRPEIKIAISGGDTEYVRKRLPFDVDVVSDFE